MYLPSNWLLILTIALGIVAVSLIAIRMSGRKEEHVGEESRE